MGKSAIRELIQMAQQAGYEVASAEQLRPNRWLLILTHNGGTRSALLVQARPLLSSADVLDLADLVRLRGLGSGILLAHGGIFSPAAQSTYTELADHRLRLCTILPPAPKQDQSEAKRIAAALKSIS